MTILNLSLQGRTSDSLNDNESKKHPAKIVILENKILKRADNHNKEFEDSHYKNQIYETCPPLHQNNVIIPPDIVTANPSHSFEVFNQRDFLDDVTIEYLNFENENVPDDALNLYEISTNEEIGANEKIVPDAVLIENENIVPTKRMIRDEIEAGCSKPSLETNYSISDDDSLDKNIVPYSDSSDSSTAAVKTKCVRKKRINVKSSDWKQDIFKRKREFGYPYKGKKKQIDAWHYDIEKEGRMLKHRCMCKITETNSKLKCNEITKTDRENIFKTFWALSWDQKKVFVNNTMKINKIRRPRDRKNEGMSRRKFSNEYYLQVKEDNLRVCKQMYINTLSIGEWTVLNWKKQGLTINANYTVTKTIKQKAAFAEKKEGLEQFIKILPLMESHYCRKNSTKLYLQPDWPSKQAIYKFYKDVWCTENEHNAMSSCSFYNALEKKNISIFKPKKDECELCAAYKSANLSQSDYDEHISKKDEARNEKMKDKENEKHVFAMDLQAVLLCPKSNVSSLYYKMKLKVHNFCMYNLNTKDTYCFLWNETEGGVNSEEFASIVAKFLTSEVCPLLHDDDRQIIIYSDGCTAQNRNSVMANALLNVSMLNNVVIEQKYLEKGHTQMEVDSVHACIERKLKNKIINVPADYISVCKEARVHPKPYYVHYLMNDFFNSYKDILFYKSIRPGKKPGDATVTDIRALKYMPDGQILYKLKFSDLWTTLPQRKNVKVIPKELNCLPNLYNNRLKVTKRKFDDLQSLKNSMPKDFHNYYDSIPYED